MLRLNSRPIRTVFRWQFAVTAIGAAGAGWLAGFDGALSALLGGVVSIAAGLVFIWVASFGKSNSAEATVFRALRAEAARIGAIVALLWIVFASYEKLVALAFLAVFVVTVVIFSLAVFVRDK